MPFGQAPGQGFNNPVNPRIIKEIISITGAEIFYSPAAGANNMVASVAPVSGVDDFGNAYLAGVTNYTKVGSQWFAVNMFNGELGFYAGLTTQAGPWVLSSSLQGTMSSAVPNLVANNPVVDPNGGWTNLNLNSGWTVGTNNGFADPPAYTPLPVAPQFGGNPPSRIVGTKGTLVTPASGGVTGVSFSQVPLNFRPQAGPFSRINGLVNNGGGQDGRIDVHSDGNLQLSGNFGNSAIIDISGIYYI
jgi:hypothetical protein